MIVIIFIPRKSFSTLIEIILESSSNTDNLLPKIPTHRIENDLNEIVSLSEEKPLDNKLKLKKRPILARTVLWHLTFIGFAVHYMIRINMNIAIVDMVLPRRNHSTSVGMECFINYTHIEMPSNSKSSVGRALPKRKGTKVRFSFERKFLDAFHVRSDQTKKMKNISVF